MERITNKKNSTAVAVPALASVRTNALEGSQVDSFAVIIKPLVTEKSAVMQSVNKYSFIVAAAANKMQVKAAVKQLYSVDPVAIHMINVQGHRVRSGKSAGKRSDFKKAIVTLKSGQTIALHEGV